MCCSYLMMGRGRNGRGLLELADFEGEGTKDERDFIRVCEFLFFRNEL